MLPMIELPSYVITLPMSKKEIKVRPYTVGEEISFITANEQKDVPSMVETLFDIFRICVLTKGVVVEELSLIDFFYTLIFIRSKSKGETVDVDKKCKMCGSVEPLVFNLIDSLQMVNEEVTTEIFETDNITVKLMPLKATVILSIARADNEDDAILYSIANAIEKVVIGGKVYSEFTQEELIQNLLMRLPETKVEELSKKFNGMVSMRAVVNSTCAKCKSEQEFVVEDLFNFLF